MPIKIALAQISVQPGQPRANLDSMLIYLKKAKENRADLIIFPELAIPGYLLGDLWEYDWFLRECEQCGRQIIQASEGIVSVFGNIAVDWQKRNEDGRVRKYNACFVAQRGSLVNSGAPYPFYVKTALPNYRQFDDTRHFYSNIDLALESGRKPADLLRPFPVDINGRRLSLGCIICEDGWTDFYNVKPPLILAQADPDIFINISSSPFALGKTALRRSLFADLARRIRRPLLYLNHTGIQNNGKNIYIYDGSSYAFTAGGEEAAAGPAFASGLFFCHYDEDSRSLASSGPAFARAADDDAYKAVIYGSRLFLEQCRIKTMAIGVSGGIDSAVAAALFTHILGKDRVLCLNMPSRYNSATTISLAENLTRRLGAHYAQASITDSFELTKRQITSIEINGRPLALSDLALENIQARDRSSRLLAAASAAWGGGFSCNANKSEISAGYGTFYGDLAGLAAPLGDLWKHQVYALGRYLNETVFGEEVIPPGIFSVTPSAELSYDQTVGRGGDPFCYPYHDYLFRAFVESNLSPLEIAVLHQKERLEKEIGCEPGLVRRLFPTTEGFLADLERWWLTLGGLSVAKRIQAPPIVTVSSRAFGFERRETQIPAALPPEYLVWKEQTLRNK